MSQLKTGILLSFFLLLIGSFQAQAQFNVKDSLIAGAVLRIGAGVHFTAADMADRFGSMMFAGAGAGYKFRSNIVLDVNGAYLFGSDVRETSIFDGIIHPDNVLYGTEGLPANVTLQMRGWYGQAQVGKVFPILGPNPNSGLIVMVGAGLLQHKIRIQVNREFQENLLPQLSDDYQKGYDRLSNGLTLNQFIGYQHLDNRKLINFYAGIETMQGFTKNRRSWDFDTNSKDDRQRTDILYGLKIGWIFPIYRQNSDEIYTY